MAEFAKDDPAWADDACFDGAYTAKRCSVSGIDLYYTDWNPGAANVAILLHGFNVQSHTWDPVASALSRTMRVICPDLRGHGRSGWSRDGYWSAQFATDCAGILQAEGIRECHIVGHSLGVRVAIALAGLRPDLARSLLLSDGGPELANGGVAQSVRLARERAERTGFNDPGEALALYEDMHPEWRPIFRALHVRHQLRPNWVGKLVERADPELAWITRSAGRRDNAMLWALSGQIKAPVKLLWSKPAGFLNDELIAKYRAYMPSLEDVPLECGHYIPREWPEEFCNQAMRFWARQPDPT
ncbi:alpha/beta hydrolase [Sphingomonas sp. CGMCC 1.13654]|uniref:Alpha/beta hydrolase n=1 Tax=Sphingomonas chungangi TaxID=2683589 RepID=A0A838L3C1_9SPHN|nr:alpha/beta hydrolase [Sphingomonas chungangi]MBA2933022.1 alpha/beta hydrolase [Sphingomonas chungangi]MVW56642.1 alpha/beta fold hydrolase [Sphingomonas chungangi]